MDKEGGNLGVCVEAIRRAYLYLGDLRRWIEHPRTTGNERGRAAVEDLAKTFEIIANNCPTTDFDRDRFNEWARRARERPWQTVARFTWNPEFIEGALNGTLRVLAVNLGYDPDKHGEIFQDLDKREVKRYLGGRSRRR